MLFIACENIGRLGHEMNATENDVFRIRISCLLAEHE